MKTAILCTAIVLLMTVATLAQGNGSAVTLDEVEGLVNGNIQVGTGIVTLHYGFTNGDSWNQARGISNGFEFYGSDSSVTWELNYWEEFPFPLNPWIIFFSPPPIWHAVGADTIGFRMTAMVGAGLPPGYSGPALVFTAEMTDTASVGGTFCIDSCWYPPDGTWIWAYNASVGSFPPTWDGPHCWPIVRSCCVGYRGNINGDPGDQIDISDLVYLVDYMFNGGPAPPCTEEADIDGSEEINIADLVWLVDYMFNFGFPPADCP